MRLDELIRNLKTFDPTWNVCYDFCRCIPTTFDSWRGVYSELALGWSPSGYDSAGNFVKPPTVAELLDRCHAVIGSTYHGYKGGEFRMTKDTDVHVDNYSEYTSTSIVAVSSTGYSVILRTQYTD